MNQITHVLLDLDGTLYPKENGVWQEISRRMEIYMAEEIGLPGAEMPALRNQYLRKYGTTLRGLIAHYQIDAEHYLNFVHGFDASGFLSPDPLLKTVLQEISQPKYIFTNSDHNHTHRVLAALGISEQISGVFDLWKMNLNCKPHPAVYDQVVAFCGAESARQCLFVEDTLQNLIPARKIGMTTVLVDGTDETIDYNLETIHALSSLPPLQYQRQSRTKQR